MTRRLILTTALLLLVGAPLAASSSSTAADAQAVTWSEHVAPILFQNCVSCHRPGQVAPMSLLSYEEARPWAKSIRRVTAEGEMPPWFANPEHGDFVEDSRLSAEEIEILGRWVAAGAPQGDPARTPEPPTFASEWKIGEPDAVFTMEPFEVTDDMEDHYQWMSITNHLDEDRWIRAVEVRPTFMEAAHHNLSFVVPEGMGPEALGSRRDLLIGWAPGAMPFVFDDGLGKLLPARSTILFQMHYHKTPGPGTGGVDQTSIGVKFYEPEEKVEPVTTMWVMDPAINIPPGAENYVSTSEFTFEDDGWLYNMTPHMHLRGKSFRYEAYYPDGSHEVLLDVPSYDFNWQLTYTPREPKRMPKGTRIVCTGVYDNSSNNPFNPDPSINVRWGEETTDEMMIGFMEYTYDNIKDDRPTASVPPHLREMFQRRMREEAESGR